MFFTFMTASPVRQQADGREAALEAELASFSSRGPDPLLLDTDPWLFSVPTIHAPDAETQDAAREINLLAPAERRRPGRVEYDNEALIQLLRQQGVDTEQPTAPARVELPDAIDLRPAVGLIVSIGLSILLWVLSLGALRMLI